MRRLRVIVALVAVASLASAGFVSGTVRADEPSCWPYVNRVAAPARARPCPVTPGVALEIVGGEPAETPWREHGEARGEAGIVTAGFLFSGDDGHTYLSTSGSCCFSKRSLGGPKLFGPDDVVVALNGHRIGTIAYAVWYGEARYDFALVRLDPSVARSARVPYFGGPTGLYTEHADRPTPIYLVGSGNVAAVGRPALALTTRHQRHLTGTGAGVTLGDPGGPVLTPDGRAIGSLSNFLPEQILRESAVGDFVAARIDWSLVSAERTLGTRLTLLTAPRNF